MGAERGDSKKLYKQDLKWRSEVGTIKVEELRDLHDWQISNFDRSKTSDFYNYTRELVDNLDEINAPYFHWYSAEDFYYKDLPAFKAFSSAEVALEEKADALFDPSYGAADMLQNSGDILNAGFDLVRNFSRINSAKPSMHVSFSHISSIQRFQMQKFYEEIGPEKPETFRETMRRYIPRWMTEGIVYDSESEEDRDTVTTAWNRHAKRDAGILIHPDRVEKGEAPLHVVFGAARMVEDAGKKDVGYDMRVSGILQLLAMEQEAMQKENPEIPFFHTVFAGLMTGETRTPKHAYFDFQSAVDETMGQTFSRYGKELSEGRDGPASRFLNTLSEYYKDSFPELLAKSLVNHGKKIDSVDEVSLLHKMKPVQAAWFDGVYDHIEQLPDRKVLRAAEVTALAPHSLEENGEVPYEQFTEDVALLVEQGDTYSFNTSLSRIGLEVEAMKSDVSVELDAMSESITAVVHCVGDKVRSVPFGLSISGEKESLQTSTLGKEMPGEEVVDKYRTVVARALHREADKIRAKEKRSKKSEIQVFDANRPELRITQLTREERMAWYASQKAQAESTNDAKPQVKTVPETQKTTASTQEGANGKERTILGMDYDSVDALLKAERIDVISTEAVMRKLGHFLDMANASGKTLGKMVSRKERVGHSSEGLNLRQINWILSGGSTQIRIYLQGIGSGEFVLRGIMDKKGENQQNKFIDRMIERIRREGN